MDFIGIKEKKKKRKRQNRTKNKTSLRKKKWRKLIGKLHKYKMIRKTGNGQKETKKKTKEETKTLEIFGYLMGFLHGRITTTTKRKMTNHAHGFCIFFYFEHFMFQL